MVNQTEPLDVGQALRGTTLLLTGATGFLGKVVLEKLLWSVPEIGTVLVLIRPEAGLSAAERLDDEILNSPCMARLRALHGERWQDWVRTKVEVVSGDLGMDRFGLGQELYTTLCERVERVIGCAASVAFDERLDRALEVNVYGAARTLALARDAGEVPLVHVSTCFVSGQRRGAVPEGVLEPAEPALDRALETLTAASSAAAQDPDSEGALVTAGVECARRHGFHDAYTLTKALAERLIVRDRRRVPVAIVRPAIIESAIAEPIPGWIEAVRVTDPMLVAYGRGRTRTFAGSPEGRLDVVPVDTVANAVIVALAALPPPTAGPSCASRPAGGSTTRVYQVSSARNPLTLGDLLDHAREGFLHSPLLDSALEPISPRAARFERPDRYRRKLVRRRRLLELLGRRLGALSAGQRASTAARELGHFIRLLDIYRPYLDHGARYEDSATRELASRLSGTEVATFPLDLAKLDWRRYLASVHVPGLIQFALKAECGTPPARRRDAVATEHAQGSFPAAEAATLPELFERAAQADTTAMAFQTCREGRWLRYSYGQASTAIANVSNRLAHDHGIQRGDRVVLWGTACPEWLLTSFAIHRLGATTVPLDPQWPIAEVEQAARLVDAKLICAAPSLGKALAESSLPWVAMTSPWVPEPTVGLLPGTSAGHAEATASAEDLATILFTSGTTVAPKAVPLTHRNLMSNVRDLAPVMRLSRERLLSVLPIHHVFEFTVGHLVPLVGGSTISYVTKLEPEEIHWMMNATRPTVLVAVPRILELLHAGIGRSIAAGGPLLGLLFKGLFGLSTLTRGRYGSTLFGKVHRRFGGHLRRIATGGAALEPELGRRFQLMGFRVAEGYGLTETSPVLSVNPWQAIRLGTVGRPLPGVEISLRPRLAPDTGPAVGADPASREREIWVRGGSVTSGYLDNIEANEAAFEGGWFRTGDLGTFDDRGYLTVVGRSKDVIVTSAGKNVYPEEVEHRYRDLEGVRELVVLGLPTFAGCESVAAVVVVDPDTAAVSRDHIRAAIAERSRGLPSYQQISRIEFWEGELPKTTTLKIQRGAVRDAFVSGRPPTPSGPVSSQASTVAPSPAATNESEQWVLAMIARLTRTRQEALRGSDRLAELGIDSLARVEMAAELEIRFGVGLDDRAMGNLARVEDVFQWVAGAASARDAAPLHS